MKILVDTHVWLWLLSTPERLRREALDALLDPANEVYFSVASAWEIIIKHGLGKLTLPGPPEPFVPERVAALGHKVLTIELRHVLAVAALPQHHKDPFDRVLLAQALSEGITLVTSDTQLARYPGPIHKV